jgi:CRP/FNR family transcriptional regulator, anaerobic regulatory protein
MLAQDEIKKLFPLFEPSLVEEMSTICSMRSFSDGDFLMKTGQYIRSTMIILSGLVKVYREDEEGDEYFMYYIEPGQACALSLVCSLKQNISELTARAVGDVEVITIPLDKMDAWMMRYKTWYQFVLGTYRTRFEELLTTIDQVAFRNMDERLVFYLKKNAGTLKTNIIPFTHAEIATELNSSREVISRLMKKLADKGMVKIHRNSVEIIDLEKLA